MITIQVKNIEGKTKLPVRGSAVAAGYDIVAVDDPIIVGEIGNEKEVNGQLVKFYRNIDYIEYHTALHISPLPKFGTDLRYHTLIHPRSSIRKYNLVLANSIGLIDTDYTGEILCCFKYMWQPDDMVLETEKVATSDGGTDYSWEMTGKMLGKINYSKIYKKGDTIAQLVSELTEPASFELVSELIPTVRGSGGFGSTTRITEQVTTKAEVKMADNSVPSGLYPKSPDEKDIKKYEARPGGSTLSELYQKAGGVPTKKKYIDEIRERDGQ
jgi:dUTPase